MTMTDITKTSPTYELLPPEGGWGYLVATGIIITQLMGWSSMQTFGIIYGPFLASTGNEAESTSIVSSTFNTMAFLSGLPGNVLLQKFSNRKVAFLGAFLYIAGMFSTIFVSSANHMIFTFGILQGLGWGLQLLSGNTIFVTYFHTRRNVVMHFVKAVMSVMGTVFPVLSKLCVDAFGFRGTVALRAAISLHLLFAALCLQPVKWHMKRRRLTVDEIVPKGSENVTKIIDESDSLLHNTKEVKTIHNTGNELDDDNYTNVNESSKRFCSIIYQTLDLGLFKDLVYVNIVIGMSLNVAADLLFTSFMPYILNSAGFHGNEVPLLITIHLIFDFIGKISLCVMITFLNMQNRHLQLFGAFVAAIFRIGFLLSSSFWWTAFLGAVLGFVRCAIQNSPMLVFAEMYRQRYVTSLSLYTVVNGIVILVLGQIIGYLSSICQNNHIAMFVLVFAPIWTAITWTAELMYPRIMQKSTSTI